MTWLVVGLGNPGQKYERTRHSVGHMVINAAAEKFGGTLKKHRAGAFLAGGSAMQVLRCAGGQAACGT